MSLKLNICKIIRIKIIEYFTNLIFISEPISETWKDRNSGERQERTQWHNISILSEPLVNIAESFLKKGSKVYLEAQGLRRE